MQPNPLQSPGVLRIYLASMIILAGFYACSAVVQVRRTFVAFALVRQGCGVID